MSVLIIDDSAFMRKALRRMIDADPDLEVVGVAQDGAEGVKMAHDLKPSIITLDVKMPVMDGLEALRRILADRPVPVLMLSSLTGEGAEVTIKALELGALDFIDKTSVHSSMDITTIGPTLIGKLKALGSISQEKVDINRSVVLSAPAPEEKPALVMEPSATHPYEIVVIGSSTGGPGCLQALLLALPKSYSYPIVIVQHMPIGFTKSLAERLNSICEVEVVEGREGETLTPGKVVIAPAGQHLVLRRRDADLVCSLSGEPSKTLHKPSVDVLFASAVKTSGPKTVGVLLTGMGKDGAKGLLALKEAGAVTIVQDEKTSVVWGMPRAAVEIGAAQFVLPLLTIRNRLLELATSQR